MDSLNIVYRSLYSSLTENSALMSVITGVYDYHPEQYDPGPYITFSNAQIQEGRLLNDSERRVLLSIDVWAPGEGRKQLIEIMDLVQAALPAVFLFEDSIVLFDEDSKWWHGVLEYRIYLR